MIFEVQSGKTEGLSRQYETMQEKAQTKGNTFTKFVQEQWLGHSQRGETGDVFKSLFASMKDVGQSIVKGLTHVGGPDRTQIIEQLRAYKWSAFQRIEQKR